MRGLRVVYRLCFKGFSLLVIKDEPGLGFGVLGVSRSFRVGFRVEGFGVQGFRVLGVSRI